MQIDRAKASDLGVQVGDAAERSDCSWAGTR
jgi:hypothetical protein